MIKTVDWAWPRLGMQHACLAPAVTRNCAKHVSRSYGGHTDKVVEAQVLFSWPSQILDVSNFHLRCPEILLISHENANFLFSVFRVVQSEAKTPKIIGCCRANFAFLPALKMGTFREKWTLEWVIKTSHLVLLALYFLIISKLAFSLIASQRCPARTAKNVWVRAQNIAKNNFLPLRLETY